MRQAMKATRRPAIGLKSSQEVRQGLWGGGAYIGTVGHKLHMALPTAAGTYGDLEGLGSGSRGFHTYRDWYPMGNKGVQELFGGL